MWCWRACGEATRLRESCIPLALDGEEDRPVLAGGLAELVVQRFAPKADGARDVPHAPDHGTHFQHFLFLRSKKERRCARLALVKQK